jgi:hypothetical protein
LKKQETNLDVKNSLDEWNGESASLSGTGSAARQQILAL